jgi:hypothetical protein
MTINGAISAPTATPSLACHPADAPQAMLTGVPVVKVGADRHCRCPTRSTHPSSWE